MVADTLEAGAAADSLDDLFIRLEAAGILMRIDRSVVPTMAKIPTLAQWELDQLRTVENVVRLGHIKRVDCGSVTLEDDVVTVADDALVVHCAASGLKYPPRIPIWGEDKITLQAIRAGFPCFGAALAGYVEATRDDEEEKNRLCPATPYGNSKAEWVLMNVRGMRAVSSFNSEPDIKAWADGVPLNPARIPAEVADTPAVTEAIGRVQAAVGPGLAGLASLCGAD